jgi:hypothetical protein
MSRRPEPNRNPARLLLLGAALVGLVVTPAGARANIIFTQAATQTDTNIGAYTVQGTLGTSTTAFGQEIGNGPNLLQVVTNTPLSAPSAGQARVEAFSSSNLFTTVTFTPTGSASAFSVIELNPQILTPQGSTGFFRLSATDQFNVTFVSQVFELSNGQNRVDAIAQTGEVITSLTLTSFSNSAGTTQAALINDVRQVRVTLAVTPLPVVPEPATMASAVSGLLVLGIGGVRRLRRRAAAA